MALVDQKFSVFLLAILAACLVIAAIVPGGAQQEFPPENLRILRVFFEFHGGIFIF